MESAESKSCVRNSDLRISMINICEISYREFFFGNIIYSNEVQYIPFRKFGILPEDSECGLYDSRVNDLFDRFRNIVFDNTMMTCIALTYECALVRDQPDLPLSAN